MGCRRTTDVSRLVRVGRTAEGTLAAGRSIEGRGAWICSSSRSCFDLAVKRDAFRRAFRAPIDRVAIEKLGSELFDCVADRSHFVPGHPPARDY